MSAQTDTVGHISLRVESSQPIIRKNGLDQPVKAVLVRGRVCTPAHMADTAVSMLVLNFTGEWGSAEDVSADAIPPNTLLLCHNCQRQYERTEDELHGLPADDDLDPSPHGHTKVGANKDGMQRWDAWSAQWCGVYPLRRMLYGMSKVTLVSADAKNPRARAHIDILATHRAERLRTVSDLDEFFRFHMRGEVDGLEHNANSLIRLISPESGQIITLWVYSARRNIEIVEGGRRRSFSVAGSWEEAWDEAVIRGSQAKGLAQVVASALGADVKGMRPEHVRLAAALRGDVLSDKILIEAIPGERIRIIGDSLRQLAFPSDYPKSFLAEFSTKWLRSSASKEGQGFMPMHTNVLIGQPMARDVNQLATVVAAKFAPEPDVLPSTPQEFVTPHFSPRQRKKTAS